MSDLLQWLEDFVMRNTSISARWKTGHTSREYWIELAKREDKFIRTTNFHTELSSYATIPDDLLVLTEDHKTQIREKFEFYTENFYPSTLWLLTRILSDYEKSDDLNNPIPVAILRLRKYVNQLFKEHYPEQYNQIERELEKARKGHVEKAKIICVECGSQNVRSYGDRWKCNACGRTFLKKPRTKHYHKQ